MTAIIITGRKRGGPRQMAAYLLDQGENESIAVRQVNGFVAKTIKDALAEMWAVADGSKAKDFLYHATINPRPGVKLSQQQWKQAVDRLEKNLKLAGHQRVVVEHVKKGRTHYHIVWNRVNPLTGTSQKLSRDRLTCRNTALQLGAEFQLEPTANKGQSFKRSDIERGKRTGIDPKRVKEEVTILWNRATSGKDFVIGLQQHGYILARGDRNQFVIIDKAGSTHGLVRRIKGATAKTVRRGTADIDPNSLPTIQQVKERIKATRPKRSRKPRSSAKSGRTGTVQRTRQKSYATTAYRPYGFVLTARHPYNATPTSHRPGISSGLPMIGGAPPSSATIVGTTRPETLTQLIMPNRPLARGGMSEVQRADFEAACEGKITWRQYFLKWGNEGLTL